jgi:hypothetical protein
MIMRSVTGEVGSEDLLEFVPQATSVQIALPSKAIAADRGVTRRTVAMRATKLYL